MAIRVSFGLGRVIFLALAAATVGCVAEKPQVTEELPAFRSPTEIKPADTIVRPAPAPAAEATEPTVVSKPIAAPVAAWVPMVRARDWKYIVIHHSATPDGNAAKFDREHKAKGWDELGYHFVIDNGRGGPDGRVEVGPRWPKQKWGAHAKTPDNRFNEHGIGICFVGNFESGRPTPKQMQAAAKLVAWLMQTYNIPARNVIGHDDTKSTLCPGRNMNLAQVRSLANDVIAGVDIDNIQDAPVHARVAVGETQRELLIAR